MSVKKLTLEEKVKIVHDGLVYDSKNDHYRTTN